jgi:hypothetical protein
VNDELTDGDRAATGRAQLLPLDKERVILAEECECRLTVVELQTLSPLRWRDLLDQVQHLALGQCCEIDPHRPRRRVNLHAVVRNATSLVRKPLKNLVSLHMGGKAVFNGLLDVYFR